MITICFTTPKHWTLLSWLIKRFTKSEVSHAAIGAEIYGVPVLVHCTAGGVQITHRAKYEQADRMVEEYLVKPDVRNDLYHLVQTHLGDSYDYWAIPGYAVLLTMWRWFKVAVKNPFASPTAMVCSEFVMHLNHGGQLKEWAGLDSERTTAQDLLVRCRTGKNFQRIR